MKKITYLPLIVLFLCYSCQLSQENVSPASFVSYEQGYLDDFAIQSGDQYATQEENPFINVEDFPISTFSIDADGASYANIRRFITQDNSLPPKNAVRTEELINYFELDYPYEDNAHPLSLNGEVSVCPWNNENKLIRIGIKGQPIEKENLAPSNYVFLIDVSGSMGGDDRLDLLKRGFISLIDELSDEDRVAIVTYSGSAGVVLPSAPASEKQLIKRAIAELGSGGSTAGAEGIITAYEIAQENLIPDGNNRIIIGTDGDFNVGPSSFDELIKLIKEKRDLGIFLTVLGVGRGNLNDATLEQLANNGNGTYEYIDNLEQLKKVFVYDYNKFYTVAKDVKIQVAFHPEIVSSYRLIGYENRLLNTEDFEDDKKDAGEIGSNQNITALYEIVPKVFPNLKSIPTFSIDLRYKEPNSAVSTPMELAIFDEGTNFKNASDFMKFTSSIAAYSMLVTDSPYKGSSDYNEVLNWLNATSLSDPHGFKAELITIIEKSSGM